MQRNTRMIPNLPVVARANATLPVLARAWLRGQRQYAAAARLRAVAPDPLPRPDPLALAAALGLRPRDAEDPVAVLAALGRSARANPDARLARALSEAVDEVLDGLDP